MRTSARRIPPGLPAIPGLDALGNWVSIFGVTVTTQTQSAVAEVPLASVALKIKYSNTFRYDLGVAFGGNTNTELITLNLRAMILAPPVAAPIFAAAGAGSIDTSGVTFSLDASQDLRAPANFGAVLSHDAAGVPANSYTFNGASPFANGAAVVQAIVKTKTAEVITGTLQAGQLEFPVDGLWTNSHAFRDSWVIFTLTLTSTAAGGTVVFGGAESLTMSLQEQPLGARF